MQISKKWKDKNPGEWVLLDKSCKTVHLDGRKRISLNTARNWLKALNLPRKQALCTDGKRRAAITKEVETIFLNAYRAKLAFHVVKK